MSIEEKAINLLNNLDPKTLKRVYTELKENQESAMSSLGVKTSEQNQIHQLLCTSLLDWKWTQDNITPGLAPPYTFAALHKNKQPRLAQWFYLQCSTEEQKNIIAGMKTTGPLTRFKSVTVTLPFDGGIECVDEITRSPSHVQWNWQNLIVDAMTEISKPNSNNATTEGKSRVTLWTSNPSHQDMQSHPSRFHVALFPIPEPNAADEKAKVVLYNNVADDCITLFLKLRQIPDFLKNLFQARSISDFRLNHLSCSNPNTLTLTNQTQKIPDVLTLKNRILGYLKKQVETSENLYFRTQEKILPTYVFSYTLLDALQLLIDDFISFCEVPREMITATRDLLFFSFFTLVYIPAVILRIVIELPLIVADAVLEHARQRVANSKLHCRT